MSRKKKISKTISFRQETFVNLSNLVQEKYLGNYSVAIDYLVEQALKDADLWKYD